MARSGSVSIVLNSQNQENNTSSITVKGICTTTDGSWRGDYREGTYTIKQGSTTLKSGSFTHGAAANATTTLFTVTLTVKHNDDGTSGTITATFNYDSGWCTGTKSTTLTTIPRKSTLSVAAGTLGTAQTLTVSKKLSSFTHTIVATCGAQSTTICTKSSSTSISFTPPLGWASENTTGTSLSVKYTITTYNGSTSIGSDSYTVTCSIPSSVKPSCSVAVTDPMGYAGTYGGFIKGLSKFKVVVTPTTSYGSAIASYSTTANGSTYTESSFTTGVLASSGTLTVNATVKDKRGRSGSASSTATVLDYSPPVVTKLAVKRCNADGTENDQGTHCKVTFSATITSLNSKNSAAYKLQYKKTSASGNPTEVNLTTYAGKYSVADGTYIFAADTGSSYNITLSATDNFNSNTRTTSVSTGFTLMHWLASGLGMALGKVAELAGVLDIGFQTRFFGGILQPILADGVDFNTIMTPNTYSGKNASTSKYVNCPISSAYSFSLEVIAANDNSQIVQRLTVFNKTSPDIYERVYYGGSWGTWTNNNPYPVGSIYMSINNTNPSTLFGGTWEQIKDVFLLAAGNTYAAGKTGGSATHTLTVAEMPSHTHTQNAHSHSTRYKGFNLSSDKEGYMVLRRNESADGYDGTDTDGAISATATNQNTGGGGAHNNMPPYLAVYVWKRTA